MLRMRKTTDYGFVVLAFFARNHDADAPRVHTARTIAEATGLPQPTIAKVLQTLGRSGLVDSTRGLCGGYALARDPREITVVEVVELFEGPVALTECALPAVVTCDDHDTCEVGERWQPINHAVRSALAGVTLAQISGGPSAPVVAEAAK